MKNSLLILLLLISTSLFSQQENDSIRPYRKERIIVHSASALIYAGSFIALNNAWYKQYERSSFHFFDDRKEWLQVDKVGHAQTAYVLSANVLYPVYQKLGYSKKQSIAYAMSVSWLYQATIELLDGYSAKWGASWSDLGANTLGVVLFGAQQAFWDEQRILFKYSTSTVDYKTNDPVILDRADRLYGTSLVERLFKDYNGTTYWLSGNISSFLPQKKSFPKWLCLSVGYGAQGMLGGFNNKWTTNGISYNYSEIDRYRQYYLSVDIDFTKVPVKGKAWPFIAQFLNIFKLPAPTLEFNKFGLNGHFIYF